MDGLAKTANSVTRKSAHHFLETAIGGEAAQKIEGAKNFILKYVVNP